MRSVSGPEADHVVSSGSDKAAVGHQDSIGMGTDTIRSRENVYEIYRFVLEELQKEARTATCRQWIATNHYRDLLGQHHL
jgi:hypothetical protein